MLKSHIFRAYDIRGIVDQDFDEVGAKLIGQSYALYLKKINPKAQKIVVGRDGRTHSLKLQKAFIKGALAEGLDVTDIDLATSPLLNFAICAGNFDGGVNITASHNPQEFNGFKLQKANAHAIFGSEIEEIYQLTQTVTEKEPKANQKAQKADFSDQWLDRLASLVKIPNKPKIAVDCGNGVTGAFVEQFFAKLNLEIVPLYTEVDGTFPNHEANPEEEANLEDLKKAVITNGCDLGIAFDGDGDRVGIVDHEGQSYAADLLLILLARDILSRNPGTSIVYDLKATEVLAEEIKKYGGKPILCQTGHSFVEGKMAETGALLGGEVSGHIFIAENYYGFDDAFLAAGKLIEIITSSQKTIQELLANLPETFVTPEIKVSIAEEHKFATVAKIVKHFTKEYPGKVLTIDGARISFEKGAWGIVRASNTSPYLTTRFEARSKEKLQKIKKIVFDHLESYPEINL
jgi:phosphomannomutase/phosphoglucomutase